MWGVYDYHRGGVCGRVYVYQGGVYVYQGPFSIGWKEENSSLHERIKIQMTVAIQQYCYTKGRIVNFVINALNPERG